MWWFHVCALEPIRHLGLLSGGLALVDFGYIRLYRLYRSGSPCGIIPKIAMSTGLMCLDCSEVTTENSAICVCFLMRYGDSVVLVTLTAILLSNIVDIEWEISTLADSVNFSNGVTVPVVFHFDGWSMKAVIVFVVVGGMVGASSVMTGYGFVVVSLEAVLNCIVKWGKCMRPCVVWMTTLLFLIKCNPINGRVNFSITTKCSAKELSPISNFSVALVTGFSNWPLTTCIWKLGGSSILRMLLGAFCFIVSKSS